MEDKIEIPAGFLSDALQAALKAVGLHVDDENEPHPRVSPEFLRQLRILVEKHPEADVRSFIQEQIDSYLERE